ncbi:MAG: hypothetical protein ACOYN4_05585 [Bacteroidales bacterium]
MSTKTLPTILFVEFLPAEELVLYPKKIITPGDTTSAIGNWTKLKLTEPPSCNTTSEQTVNGLVYTTKITGVVIDDNETELRHRLQTKFHAYRLTDVYKNKYLVGTDKKPFPEIVFSPTNDASPSGRRAVDFEITWISTLPPIDIIDL